MDFSKIAARVEDVVRREKPALETVFRRGDFPYSAELTLRLLLLQRRLELTDEELLEEVADRISLRKLLGLDPGEPAPSHEILIRGREVLLDHPVGREFLDRLAREDGRLFEATPVPVLSIVSPVYRAEGTVSTLVSRIREEVSDLTGDFEIVLVDDGSPDAGWSKIEECCRADPRILGVKLSRNFGQHAAITAGLAHSRGDWVVVMDCDLQDNPRYIPQLYAAALAGADVVYTVREKREHGYFKNAVAYSFFYIFNWLSSVDKADPRVGTYSILSRRVVEAYLRLHDVHRHYLPLLRWLGFPSTSITVRHEPRRAGRSSYSFPALLRHAVNGLVAHSDRLLYLAVGAGFAFLVLSLLGTLTLVFAYFHRGFLAGWTSIVVLVLLTTSILLLAVGTAGIYIGKIFEQVKQRPLYLVDQISNASGRQTDGLSGRAAWKS